MSEKLPDLNALRQKLAEKAEAPMSKEQKTTELRAKIEEIENSSGHTNMLEAFLASTPEEQGEEVSRIIRNRGLAPDTYTLEDRKKELEEMDSAPPVLRTVRLEVLKTELEHLLAGQSI